MQHAPPAIVERAKAECVRVLESFIIIPKGQPPPPGHPRHLDHETVVMGLPNYAETVYERFAGEPVQIRPGDSIHATYDDVRTICGYDAHGTLWVRQE